MAKKRKTETFDHVPCSCGRHYGIGAWTAEKRAEVYAWLRDNFRKKISWENKVWLASYQREHGYVEGKILGENGYEK